MVVSNVVLITIDSLRFDYIEDDSRAERTPNIDQLAENGANFLQAVSNGPNTPSSFPTILTGTHPIMYGGYRYLDEDRPFLSKTMSNAGFQTVGYHSNPHLGPEKNYNYGFDQFNDGAEDKNDADSLKNFVDEHVDPDSTLYSVLRRMWHYLTQFTDTSAYANASTISDQAIDWLNDEWNGGNFFMWLHYMDVHYPFMPPDEDLRALGYDPLGNRQVTSLNGKMQERPDELSEREIEHLESLYEAELRYTDRHIGRVIDVLAQQNVLSETAIIITADHGEAFGEHERFGHHPFLYDELLRVPLIIHGADIDAQAIEQQVSLIDLPSTIYEMTGVEEPPSSQGESLWPVLEGDPVEDQVAIATSKGGDYLAVRTPAWKCFWRIEDDEIELYDLEEDPHETTDVSDEHESIVDEFKRVLEDHRHAGAATDTDLPEVDESEAVKQRLEDLGYVD